MRLADKSTTSSADSANPAISKRTAVSAVVRFLARIPAIVALAGLFIIGQARALAIPPLAEIESAIAAAHPELIKQRAALLKERHAMREATLRHNDVSKAIDQFELAGKDNPAIAPQARRMIAALRQRQAEDAASAAYWSREIVEGTRRLINELREAGINHLSVGNEKAAQEAFRDADFLSMGLPAGQ